MTKRKCEHQQLLAGLLPPCKRPLCSRSQDGVSVEKRRLESAPWLHAALPSSDGDSGLPYKKPRVAERTGGLIPEYKCQKDEAFSEYNSFQYWRTPLPSVDFSEVSNEPGEITTSDTSVATEVQEEMDN